MTELPKGSTNDSVPSTWDHYSGKRAHPSPTPQSTMFATRAPFFKNKQGAVLYTSDVPEWNTVSKIMNTLQKIERLLGAYFFFEC